MSNISRIEQLPAIGVVNVADSAIQQPIAAKRSALHVEAKPT